MLREQEESRHATLGVQPEANDSRKEGTRTHWWTNMRRPEYVFRARNHEGFQVQNSTTNADAHLLRPFLAVQANPKHVLASFDVSNAFVNAELSEDVVILTQPAPQLVPFGLVKPGTLYQCTKACYGLREAPKLWEEARDKTLDVPLSSRLILTNTT